MDQATAIEPRPSVRRASLGSILVLGAATVVALWFLMTFALPYLTLDPQRFGPYWPRRSWLLLYITSAMVALLVGPAQLWLGLTRQRLRLHRRLGTGYMASVVISAMAALYLVFHTELGWVFGMGLVGLAIAWIVTTGLAFVAIRRRMIDQHKEWMIRSYVMTFAFVTFRILFGILGVAGVGTTSEQLAAASWFCWAVPLLVTEALLQGRKIFAAKPRHRANAQERAAHALRWPLCKAR